MKNFVYSMHKVLPPFPSIDTPLYGYPLPPLYLFPEAPVSPNIAQMKCGNKHKNKHMRKVISSCLGDYKITLHTFFISSTF